MDGKGGNSGGGAGEGEGAMASARLKRAGGEENAARAGPSSGGVSKWHTAGVRQAGEGKGRGGQGFISERPYALSPTLRVEASKSAPLGEHQLSPSWGANKKPRKPAPPPIPSTHCQLCRHKRNGGNYFAWTGGRCLFMCSKDCAKRYVQENAGAVLGDNRIKRRTATACTCAGRVT